MTTPVVHAVAQQHRLVRKTLPFDDTADFRAATRGFLGALDPPIVRDSAGKVVWDLQSYAFLEGDAPPTVNPSLWRQAHWQSRVPMVFQMAPGTEAPAEVHFHLPDFRALCLAENATRTLHNILTIRGALVRDPHEWARYLTEAIELFGDDTEVAFSSHHWPTWGHDEVIEYISLQRDLYAYLHDQTLRMLNAGAARLLASTPGTSCQGAGRAATDARGAPPQARTPRRPNPWRDFGDKDSDSAESGTLYRT